MLTPAFHSLGSGFGDPVEPARFPLLRLRFRNQRAAAQVGLDHLDDAAWEQHFGRFTPLPDNLPAPLALRYHGHQFLVYNPQLGDGRGFLFAQIRDQGGRLLDLGTKGSGVTPFSRSGDGRLTLRGGVREVLASELLEALGVPTCRSFSLYETGESLWRSDEPSPTRSSVLVRLSHSHIRIGTFQYHAWNRDRVRLSRLLDWCVEHYYPAISDAPDRPAAFLGAVAERVADMTAAWMVAGFVHGVLNTDNINVTGESFDYGPWRFVPRYDPRFTAAYFDHGGLYAFGRQPDAVRWNIEQLATALLQLAPEPALQSALQRFGPAYDAALRARFVRRLGLNSAGPDADRALVEAAFRFMAESPIGYERFFFDWYGADVSRAQQSPDASLYGGPTFLRFRHALEPFTPAQKPDSPYFQQQDPCTLLYPEFQTIWNPISMSDSWVFFENKLKAIRDLGAAIQQS